MDKNGFIIILKHINKKHSPELNNELETVYNEILRIFNNTLDNLNKNMVKDMKRYENLKIDEYFYLIGYKYYLKINPKQLENNYLETFFEITKYEILIKSLKKLYLSFNVSEHYLNKIINEYPESRYLEEAKDRINLLNYWNNELLKYFIKKCG